MIFPKSLVADANILFSFFKSDSNRKFVLEELIKKGAVINVPSILFLELLNNKGKIIKFSDISPSDFNLLMSLLNKRLKIFSEEKFSEHIKKASELAPHKKDIEYFALSLSLNNCPIWSDEKSFSNQSEIKIFSTKELLKELSK